MRLNKVLAQSGIASRRKADSLIFSGKVSVNGKACLTPHTIVDLEKDRIEYQGKKLLLEKKVYYLLNKPKGYVCTSSPTRSRRAIDLIDSTERLFTVGRLDKDTSGLIIITNDGDFANDCIHPSSQIVKEYLVKVDKEVLHEHLVKISKGTLVENTKVVPASVKKVRRNTLKVCVNEGKKHEVRLLCTDAGLSVLELKRIRIGSLVLGKLPEGAYRALGKKELDLLLLKGKNDGH